MRNVFYIITKLFFFICLKVYNRLQIRGLDGIPRSEKMIVVANHCSNLDPVAVGVSFPGKLSYLAKAELFRNPVLGFFLKVLGAIPVSRESNQSAGAALKAFFAILESGSNVLLFPEGSRSFDGKLQALEGGAALIAMKSGVPVLPAYVAGTHEAMPRGASGIKPSKITITFGEMIYPEELAKGLSSKEARTLMLQRIEEALRSMERVHGGKINKV